MRNPIMKKRSRILSRTLAFFFVFASSHFRIRFDKFSPFVHADNTRKHLRKRKHMTLYSVPFSKAFVFTHQTGIGAFSKRRVFKKLYFGNHFREPRFHQRFSIVLVWTIGSIILFLSKNPDYNKL